MLSSYDAEFTAIKTLILSNILFLLYKRIITIILFQIRSFSAVYYGLKNHKTTCFSRERDWHRVGNLNSWLNRGDNRDIVASLLGNLLAVVVSITVVSVSWGWLVRVGADLIVNFLNALGTDSTGDWVALFYINNDLDSKLNEVADSLKSGGADFGGPNNILN